MSLHALPLGAESADVLARIKKSAFLVLDDAGTLPGCLRAGATCRRRSTTM
jgi:hypothetical protein